MRSRYCISRSGLLLALCLTTSRGLAEPPAAPIEVTVDGRSLSRESHRDAMAPSTVLRGEELKQPGASVAASLRSAPGTEVQRSGSPSESATVSTRGGTPLQVPVYLAGLRLNDPLTGSADLGQVGLFFVDRIELFRGHAPGDTEQLGLGGAVLIEPEILRRSEARLGASVGSYGHFTRQALVASASRKQSAAVAWSRTTASNNYPYTDDQGTRATTDDDRRVTRENADTATDNLWFLGRSELPIGGRVLWFGNAFQRDRGVTGLSVIPARHSRERTTRGLFGLESRLPCRVGPACRLVLLTGLLQSAQRLTDPHLELGLGTTRLDSNARRLEQRVNWSIEPLETLSVDLMLLGEEERLALVPRGGDSERVRQQRGQLGTTLRVQLDPTFELLGHGRVSWSIRRPSVSPSREAAGRLGARWRPHRTVSFVGNLGAYQRPATLGELYGTSAFVVGNAELGPERGTNLDLAVRYATTKGAVALSSELVGYASFVRELVAWQRSSFGQVRPYNVGQARLLGVELDLGAEWARRVLLRAAGTLLDPRDRTPGRTLRNDILAYRARLALTTTLDVHTAPEDHLPYTRMLGIGARLWHRASRYAVPSGTVVLPHVTTVGLDARWELDGFPLTLRGQLDDLFDAPVSDVLGMPLGGRSYYAGAEVRLLGDP